MRKTRELTGGLPLVSLVMVLLGFSGVRVNADLNTPLTPPPQAVPLNLQVPRGKPLVIQLRSSGQENRNLRFRIRKQPAFGKLSDVSMTGKNTATVTYTQSEEDKIYTHDRFTYSVQSPQGVSSPGAVEIEILDEPAVLWTPAMVEFGTVIIGKTARQQFKIANTGGGVVEGRVQATGEFRVEGNPAYLLHGGEQRTIAVSFTPHGARKVQGNILYSTNPERITELSGVAEAPLSVSPDILELSRSGADLSREGEIEITNRTPDRLTVEVEPGQRLECVKQIELPANGKAGLRVVVPAGDLAAVDEVLHLNCPGFVLDVKVRTPKVGAVLRLSTSTLDFGKMDLEKPAVQTVEVENIGASQAYVQVDIPAPFKVDPESASFTIGPGEKHPIQVAIQPTDGGKYRAVMKIKSSGTDQEVALQADVTRRESAQAGLPGLTATPTPQILSSNGKNPAVSTVRAVGGVEVKEISKTTCVLEWPTPKTVGLAYKIERRSVSIGADREIKVDWSPLVEVEIKPSGQVVKASLNGLRPGGSYGVRVRAINEKGEVSPPSAEIYFSTVQRPKLLTPIRVLLVLLGVLLFFIVKQKRSRRNQPATPIARPQGS